MTIDEMIESLEEARETFGGDTEVRIAYQPNYPLQSHVRGIRWLEDEDVKSVYVVESRQVRDSPYVSRELWE